MPTTHHYGSDPEQFGELYRPDEARYPGTVVIIHGGFWRARYTVQLGRPLAADLAARGYTVWNVEYRRVDAGGGWPGTLADLAAAIDHLATLDVDTSRVVTVGHSAGGQLAVWAAGRAGLPPGTPGAPPGAPPGTPGAPGAGPRVPVTAAVAQAGVLDLEVAARTGIGRGAVVDLLGEPDEVPERYAVADPSRHLPLPVPVLCLHSRADEDVPFAQSSAYVAAARAAGGRARLHETAGDHFTLIDPASPDWLVVIDALPGLMDA